MTEVHRKDKNKNLLLVDFIPKEINRMQVLK